MDERQITAIITRLTRGLIEDITRMILKKVQDVLDAFHPDMSRATGVLPPGHGGTGGTSGSAPPKGPAGGDLGGTYPNPLVDGLQGNPVGDADPTAGQVLTWDGSAWVPDDAASGSGSPTGAAGGDLYGTYPNPNVGKLRALVITTALPLDGDALTWDAAHSKLVWRPYTTSAPLYAVTDDGDYVTEGGEYVLETP